MDIKKKNDINVDDILGAAILASMLSKEEAKPKPQKDIREQARELGVRLKEMQLGFMDAGFEDYEAFELLIATLN